MSEIHVLDAVDKEASPSMSAVANHLNITLGTLTTAVKKIIKKGFLIKEQSTQDQRIYYLRLTDSGKEALKVHEQFHKELEEMYKHYIPDVYIPSERGLRLNIFGMIDRNNRYEGFSTTENMTAEKVADFLDRKSVV